MSNDIKLELRINKYMGLGIIALISMFSMANFVSLVDSKNAGGIIIEKETMNVGSVVFRMDNVNPSDIYGGTWSLLSKDSTINFGDGSIQNGTPTGINFPAVPIPSHQHGMNHDHPSVNTNTTGNHYHETGIGVNNTYNNSYPQSSPFGSTYRSGNFNGFQFSSWSHNSDFPRTNTTGNHAHNVNLPNFTGNTALTGVSNPTLDVRGQIITINVWQRTN